MSQLLKRRAAKLNDIVNNFSDMLEVELLTTNEKQAIVQQLLS